MKQILVAKQIGKTREETDVLHFSAVTVKQAGVVRLSDYHLKAKLHAREYEADLQIYHCTQNKSQKLLFTKKKYEHKEANFPEFSYLGILLMVRFLIGVSSSGWHLIRFFT